MPSSEYNWPKGRAMDIPPKSRLLEFIEKYYPEYASKEYMELLFKSKAPVKNCQACGHVPTAINKLERARDGKWVHKSHFTDNNSGYYGKN